MAADLKFGVNVSTSAQNGTDPIGDARLAEDLGFDFVSSSDHPGGSSPSFETWTMLSWMAAATTRIRFATRVLGLPFRQPAMVAKMSETFDRLSGGRLILGLGAGGSADEIASFGVPPATPGQRVDGLEDGINIIRGMWSQPAFTYAGAMYCTRAVKLEPKPERRIPIWLGTFGPRALALTGRSADGWIPTLGYASAEELPAMRDRVLTAAREAGRPPEDITCVLNLEVGLDGYAEPEPDVVTGSSDEIVERLAAFVAMGFNAFNLTQAGRAPREQLERIAAEVLPALRATI